MARKSVERSGRHADDGARSDYEVGYGKPPRHTRFQPGRSGNPRGKPKGCVHLPTLAQLELQQMTEVMEGGRRLRVSKAQLLIKTLANRAIKGEDKAVQQVLQLLAALSAAAEANLDPATDPVESAADQEILDRFLARHGGNNADDDDPA
jgi:hypothetical protein